MRILILSAVYPRPDAASNSTATKVVHYFASEWKKAGHDIVVIHTVNRLPALIYYLPENLKQIIKAKMSFEVPNSKIIRNTEYVHEGIRVFRINIRKFIPRRLSGTRAISDCADSIARVLQKINFVPNVIIGHWASPNVQLIPELKRYYTCRNALVFHSALYVKKYTKKLSNYTKQIDLIGCRSEMLAKELQELLKLERKPFICYSGVPDAYIEQTSNNGDKVTGDITRFVYVGDLIKRKNADIIIRSLADFMDRSWTLTIVGAGNELAMLQELARNLGIANRVIFCGRISRNEVLKIMTDAQVFTMVSRDEAFGLVYLEAMANSCLTIGSIGEGIDGIIEDGVNGFLCEAGNIEALKRVYRRIFDTLPEQRKIIANQGYQTASRMTDSNVADRYLNEIIVDSFQIERMQSERT